MSSFLKYFWKPQRVLRSEDLSEEIPFHDKRKKNKLINFPKKIMEFCDVLGWRGQQISLCLSTILLIILSLTKLVHTSGNDVLVQAFADRFSQSTPEEALEIWHTDCHRRCRAQLIEHVNVACTFDPYKIFITKRSVNSTVVPTAKASDTSAESSPFLDRTKASAFLATRGKGSKAKVHSRQKRGVMEECCYYKSCSWEEYAEFCHTYNRRPTTRASDCYR